MTKRRSTKAADEAVAFLRLVHPDRPWALVAIGPNGEIEAKTFLPDEAEAAHRFIADHNGRENLYYSIGIVRGRLQKKAAKADIAALPFLQVDIDVEVDWADQMAVDAAMDQTLQRLRSLDPPPTLIVFTGGGYQALWRLDQPVIVDGDKALMSPIESRNKGILQALDGDKSAFNADRIFRLPGTRNVLSATKIAKGRKPADALLVEHHPDRVYRLDQFLEIKRPSPSASLAEHRARGPADIEHVRAALIHIPPDDYDIYMRVGMALHDEFGEAGFAMYRDWAMTSEKFDETDIMRKWKSFSAGNGIGIGTLFHLAEEYGWIFRRPIGERVTIAARPTLPSPDDVDQIWEGIPHASPPPQNQFEKYGAAFAWATHGTETDDE